MRLSPEQLQALVVEIVRRMTAGVTLVGRRPIIDRVEGEIRARGGWELSDDAWSESTDSKSIGRATIDYAISDLKKAGRLENPARNKWGLPLPGTSHSRQSPPSDSAKLRALNWLVRQQSELQKYYASLPEDQRVQWLMERYNANGWPE